MTSAIRNPGRAAGFLYLLLILIGPLRLIYIPNTLFVTGDPAATAGNIAAHERLFRLGVASDLAGAILLILLTGAFYRLFADVDRHLAALVVILGGVLPGMFLLLGAVCDLGALDAVRGAGFLSALDRPQHEALAAMFLRVRDHQNTVAEILWGVWLFPLAVLIWRSRFVPRVLAIWITLGGLAYVALSLTGVLRPEAQPTVFTLAQPAFFGEIALMLWLLIRGARPPQAAVV